VLEIFTNPSKFGELFQLRNQDGKIVKGWNSWNGIKHSLWAFLR